MEKGDGKMSVVIIPVYKPDEALVAIANKLWEYGCWIIMVDDGSGEEYQPFFDKVRDICIILRHTENCGKGAAIKTALSYVKEEIWDSDVVGIMDCDGQHMPEDMIKLLTFAKAHRNTMVLGVRDVGRDMPLKSRLGNLITRKVFRFVSGLEISDTQTGLRAFSLDLLPQLLSVEGDRYEYEMNVLMALTKADIPIEEVRVHTIYRDGSNSNSHFRVVRDSIRIYKDILKFTLSSFSSFIVDYLLFSILMASLPHTAGWVLAANILARAVSAFYNYSMNCRFVFYTKRNVGTAVHYFALAVFILIMNNLILEMLVQGFRFSVYPAKLLTECLLFFLSWLIQNTVIFKKEKGLGIEEKTMPV